jgi:NAD-dependent DNA ligase
MVQKCSGHNYGLLKEKNIGIGSKIIMSLAGDIIPFLYKVTQEGGNIPMPDKYRIDGVHLMAELSEEEIARNSFTSSAGVLNIPNIGVELANKIFDYCVESCSVDAEFFGEDVNKSLPTNILECKPEEIFFAVKNTSKSGAEGNARKVMNSFKQVLETLTLKDIIKSFNFKLCGDKLSQEIANYLLGLEYDFSSKASEGYNWALDKNSDNMKKLIELLNKFGKTFDDYKKYAVNESKKTADQIPVILTGEPNNYKSKGEFLQFHPEYRVTGSWKEVQIVFTNSLESNTGKMKKAREKGIEIRVY